MSRHAHINAHIQNQNQNPQSRHNIPDFFLLRYMRICSETWKSLRTDWTNICQERFSYSQPCLGTGGQISRSLPALFSIMWFWRSNHKVIVQNRCLSLVSICTCLSNYPNYLTLCDRDFAKHFNIKNYLKIYVKKKCQHEIHITGLKPVD